MAVKKMDPKKLTIREGKDAFRPVRASLVEEYALVLKQAGDLWPFPNDERRGIRVMPATKEVKDKKAGDEMGDFIVLAGANRVRAAIEAKWDQVPVWVVKPKSEAEILRIAVASNVEHGARFTTQERDVLMKRCAAARMAQDAIAALFKVHKSTVSRVLRGLQSADSSEAHRKGGKARARAKKNGTGEAFSPDDFINEGVIVLRRTAETHHESIVAFASGNDRAQEATMQDFGSYLLRLAEAARMPHPERAA